MFQLFSDAEAVRYWSCPPWQDMKQASDYITQTLQGYADGSLRWALIDQHQAVVGVVTLITSTGRTHAATSATCWPSLLGPALHAGSAGRRDRLWLRPAGPAPHRGRYPSRQIASVRLPQSLHFRREGHLRERWFVAGEISDSLILGLLRATGAAHANARQTEGAARFIPALLPHLSPRNNR
jgi:hypothetical protein